MATGDFMDLNRVPSGVQGLDSLIEGGFPRGGVILVAGNPGTGKTVLAAEFLYHGASDYAEKGVYVSFVEGRRPFLEGMLRLGLDFEELEREGKFRVLDLVTVKEGGVEAVVETVMGEVYSLEASRLVIDPFSAVAQAFERAIDARILVHIFGKMVRQAGCTTLLVTEVPTGGGRTGPRAEEFVADGVLILRRRGVEGRPAREVEVAKLRGTRLRETTFLFSLEQGFHVFPPFEARAVQRPKRFEPIPDSATHFSTGSRDLDRVLNGGYPRGGLVLVEIGREVSMAEYGLVLAPTAVNFVSQGRAVMAVPTAGVDAARVLRACHAYGLSRDETRSLLRVAEQHEPEGNQNRPYIMALEAETPEEGYSRWVETRRKLRRGTGQPVLEVVGIDTLEAVFGEAAALSVVQRGATGARREGNLAVVLSKPGMERITQRAANASEVHLKLTKEHGALLLLGVKPRTGLYVVEPDVSRGYPLPRITPVV